ncbi:MAG TPA: dihydrofolate reductase [Dermatophilaceae bacterium]|nr:dihydrofolate reductase [Dermatophilaceae bacterium]
MLVAAVAANGVIGRDGGMPWHIPGEQRHFRAVTMGRPMVMGRRTFESIGRALPGRRSIVITGRPGWHADGAEVAGDLIAALALAGAGTVMVVGGGRVYEEAMPLAHRLELSVLHEAFPGDTVFPPVALANWRLTRLDPYERYDLVSYVRRDASPRPGRPLRDGGQRGAT